jgi:hypothetical protein
MILVLVFLGVLDLGLDLEVDLASIRMVGALGTRIILANGRERMDFMQTHLLG